MLTARMSRRQPGTVVAFVGINFEAQAWAITWLELYRFTRTQSPLTFTIMSNLESE